MTPIPGAWYPAGSSTRIDAALHELGGDRLRVVDRRDGGAVVEDALDEIEVSSRLGNTPRFVDFPGGGRFETAENDAVDALLRRRPGGRAVPRLHLLESRLRWVLPAVVLTVGLLAVAVRYGGPAVARTMAPHVPATLVRQVSEQTLEVLDGRFFTPSGLATADRERLLGRFGSLLARYGDRPFRVLFRDAGDLGANALAFPDGTIVFTDAMVRLAENDDELVAVLLHEAGHVLGDHAMRRLIQDSLLAFLAAMVVGDMSGTADIFLGLPILLTELSYSREFERDADRFALNELHALDIDPLHFANLMERVAEAYGDRLERAGWAGYLSSHPATVDRLRPFRGE